MQCCPLRPTARRHRELRSDAGHRHLTRKLYAALIGAVRRLDCLELEQLLSAIPDSNDDFVYF